MSQLDVVGEHGGARFRYDQGRRRWLEGGQIQQAAHEGWRSDKSVGDVLREEP